MNDCVKTPRLTERDATGRVVRQTALVDVGRVAYTITCDICGDVDTGDDLARVERAAHNHRLNHGRGHLCRAMTMRVAS